MAPRAQAHMERHRTVRVRMVLAITHLNCQPTTARLTDLAMGRLTMAAPLMAVTIRALLMD